MTGLDKIIEKILASARSDADAARAAAKAEADDIIAAAEAEAKSLFEARAAAVKRECDAVRSRAVSGAETAKRSALLSARAANIDEVYKDALNALISLPQESYRQFLVDLLASALAERVAAPGLSDGFDDGDGAETAEIVMNQKDRAENGDAVIALVRRKKDAADAFAAAAKSLRLSERTADIEGGFILVCGEVEINCSLSLLIDSLRDELDPKLDAVLHG